MDKAILYRDNQFEIGPLWWCAMYSHRCVGWWDGQKKLFHFNSSWSFTIEQMQELTTLLKNMSEK